MKAKCSPIGLREDPHKTKGLQTPGQEAGLGQVGWAQLHHLGLRPGTSALTQARPPHMLVDMQDGKQTHRALLRPGLEWAHLPLTTQSAFQVRHVVKSESELRTRPSMRTQGGCTTLWAEGVGTGEGEVRAVAAPLPR